MRARRVYVGRRVWRGWLANPFDDLDELVELVAVSPREVDELAWRGRSRRRAPGVPLTETPRPSSKLEQSFVA